MGVRVLTLNMHRLLSGLNAWEFHIMIITDLSIKLLVIYSSQHELHFRGNE